MQELQALLAQPLQAKFSRKFFTGVPSASLAASGGGVSSSAVPEAAAAASAGDEAAPSNSEPTQHGVASTVADSVKLAQQLEDSRTAAKVRADQFKSSHFAKQTCSALLDEEVAFVFKRESIFQ